ncbi:MAG TPA: hypothetical protein VH539_20415 [Gemmatimonadaceae bacterium]|jgi:hypothetical protein
MTALTPFDIALAGMIARGIPREKAAATLRADPRFAPESLTSNTGVDRRDLVLEKEEQAEIVKRFRVCRFAAYNLSQARASKQTPGLPDTYFVHTERPMAVWWEAKRSIGGRFSDAQREFAAHCLRCHIPYGSGDRSDAERWLVAHQFAQVIDGSLYYRP